MTRHCSYLFWPLAVLIGAVSPVQADYIQPSEVSVQTQRYVPAESDFSTGTYHYNVAWQGMPVGKATVRIDSGYRGAQPYYHVFARAKTGKVIDIFYRLRHTSESIFEAGSFKPVRFVTKQKERSREKIRSVAFDKDGRVVSTRIKNGEERDPIEFQSGNFTLDPISAAFVARGLPIEIGTRAAFDVFNGKHRYLISFLVESREVIEVNDRRYDAFKVVPSVQKLTDTKGEDRLKSAAIWITADEARDVVMVESDVLIGSVKATLEKFEPVLPDGSMQAALKKQPH